MKGRPKPHLQVTAGLIWRDGRLLISKRPEGTHLGGYWEFPGGKQEGLESLRACLEREIREELGLEVKAERYLHSVQYEYDAKSITLHFFQCTTFGGTPKTLENQKIKWVYPKELEDLTFPPPDQTIIQELIRGKIV